MPRSLRRPLAELRYIENLRATSPRRDGKRPEYAVPGEAPMPRRSEIRHSFYRHFVQQIRIVWPVISALLVLIAGMGVLVATLEGWSLLDGVYFSFVTGFTIGYGIVIGLHGILLTALLAAITVRALQATGETLKT
jgi:Ion channel